VSLCLDNYVGSANNLMNEPPENGAGADDEAANEVVTPAMRLLEMQAKHRALDGKIAELHSYPYQNQILLQRLKKEKLRLKDNIARLKNDMIPDLNA
jgi:hypothetical protein